MTLNQQISWVEDQIRWMEKSLPQQVALDRLTQIAADCRLRCAKSTLTTLTQLRTMVRGEGVPQ